MSVLPALSPDPLAECPEKLSSGISHSRSTQSRWAALSIVFSLFFSFWNLGYPSYHAEDEAHHVSVIQNMIHHGHLLIPYDEAGPYFNKPPLKMWATIPFISLFGEIPFAFRFLDGVAGFLCGLLIFHVGRVLFRSPRAGFFSTAFFFTADIVLFDHGVRSAVQDSWLLLLCSSSLWLGYRYLTDRASDQWMVTAVGIFTGLSLMIKSAGGLLGPALLGVLWLAHGAKRIPVRILLIALCGAITPIAVYGTLILLRHPDDLTSALHREIVSRVTDGFQRQNQPFFYLDLIGSRHLAIDGPWLVICLILMAVSTWKRQFNHWRLLAIWAIVPILLFSLVKTRLEWYILPAIPAHALLAGWGLDRALLGNVFYPFKHSASTSRPRGSVLMSAAILLYGAWVFIYDCRNSIYSILFPPNPVALDKTARVINRSLGPQRTVVYPALESLVPALFERISLRSLSGDQIVTAANPDDLRTQFGIAANNCQFALTTPEEAAHLIDSGVVAAYQSFPPLTAYPPQHQRNQWIVLLSAKPLETTGFQPVVSRTILPLEEARIPLPAPSFITQTLGITITVEPAPPVTALPPLTVRAHRSPLSEGVELPCSLGAQRITCEISPDLEHQARPTLVQVKAVSPQQEIGEPVIITLAIGQGHGSRN